MGYEWKFFGEKRYLNLPTAVRYRFKMCNNKIDKQISKNQNHNTKSKIKYVIQ